MVYSRIASLCIVGFQCSNVYWIPKVYCQHSFFPQIIRKFLCKADIVLVSIAMCIKLNCIHKLLVCVLYSILFNKCSIYVWMRGFLFLVVSLKLNFDSEKRRPTIFCFFVSWHFSTLICNFTTPLVYGENHLFIGCFSYLIPLSLDNSLTLICNIAIPLVYGQNHLFTGFFYIPERILSLQSGKRRRHWHRIRRHPPHAGGQTPGGRRHRRSNLGRHRRRPQVVPALQGGSVQRASMQLLQTRPRCARRRLRNWKRRWLLAG